MKMKKLALFTVSAVMSVSVLVGCSSTKTAATPTPTAKATTPAATTPASTAKATATTPASTAKVDTVTTASLVNTEDAFAKGIGKDGKWIVSVLKDLKFDKEIVLDGTFKNGKKDDKGNDVIQRKISLYEQDDKKNVTARYTLTAPKLTVNSPNARIQSGTFKGDLYISAENFELVDAKVDGNVYFLNDKAQSTFKKDDKSSVTGKTELKK